MSVAFDGMDNMVVTFRCSGTVEAGNRPEGGAVFTVRWPWQKGGAQP